MNLNRNASIEELLKAWALQSYKFFHMQQVTKEELDYLKEINNVLDSKGIVRLEVFDDRENKYTLRYFKGHNEFKAEVKISDALSTAEVVDLNGYKNKENKENNEL